MITFTFIHKDDILSGKAQYIKNENSFFYEPWNNVNFSILIGNGYNSLDVNLQTKKALQLIGLNPQMNWIRKNLIVPQAKKSLKYYVIMQLLKKHYKRHWI